jgi:TonB dependent receptor/Carboxypeptidase regulatory-like domain/TonB-dependent Receptor Plug Domain
VRVWFVGALLGGTVLFRAAPSAYGQTLPDSTLAGGTVVGTILDAGTGLALSGATVLLEPRPGGAVRPAGSAGFWTTGVMQVTDGGGGYRFTRLPPGEYRLLVRRLGYRPVAVDVELRQPDPLRLSVGLTVQPIWLEPTVVKAPRAPLVRTSGDADREALARLDVELFRQRETLESDVRVLTAGDVDEAVTLGETDLFRALHRLPGVTTRDDFTAELWTRGAPWSHTRVTFDGMPLFNPLHTAGVFSGINPDGVGAAFFHPGGRSAELGEGSAAVLALSSRPAPGAGGGIGGGAELSVVSARATLNGPLGRRGGWMLAGRRSYADLLRAYLDLLVDSIGTFTDSSGRIPYAFQDVVARVDVPFEDAATLEVSGLWERDDLRGTVGTLLRDSRGHWGNAVVRATMAASAGDVATRHTFGVSRFGADVSRLVLTGESLAQAVPSHQPTANAITQVLLRGTAESGGATRWAGGYELAALWQRYEGPPPRAYPEVVLPDTLELSARRSIVTLWGERRWARGPLAARAGLRLEVPGDVANAPVVAPSPRVSARWATSPSFAVSAAYARAYQYTQAVAPAGPGVGPDLHLSDVWLMADDSVPALRSDIATLGAELWIGQGWLGAATLYGRYTTGYAVPDPTPGTLGSGRPIFVTGANRAGGLELSARRLAGRITGSIAYSEGVSEVSAAGFTYPSSAERRRVLDATALVRVSSALRAGTAFAAASGAPFTRFVLSAVPCDPELQVCTDTSFATNAVDAANANRAPAYVTLDLFGEWSHVFRSWSLSVFVQLRNALNRRNAVTYAGSFEECTVDPAVTPDRRQVEPGLCDEFDRGLPLLPLVGVSVTF